MSGQGAAPPGGALTGRQSRREYGCALLAGAVGAGLVLLAVRQRWAQAVFTPPRPLAPQVVSVAGSDLVPLAGALALAALAGLAAVIATRGVARRVAGAAIALFGAGAGVCVATTVTAATVVAVAAGKIAAPQAAVDSGAAGSTTSGSSGGAGPLVVADAAGHAVMNGAPWRVAVFAGALLIVVAGVATVLRGRDWPVMSARYDAPDSRGGHAGGRGAGGGVPGARVPERPLDAASMWESLSGGTDPTEPDPAEPDPAEPDPAEPDTAEYDHAEYGTAEYGGAGQRKGMA